MVILQQSERMAPKSDSTPEIILRSKHVKTLEVTLMEGVDCSNFKFFQLLFLLVMRWKTAIIKKKKTKNIIAKVPTIKCTNCNFIFYT